ncbi:hypothetical protein BDV93DRAFT_174901 [Ceratobasidium sp. AG-I]|nr:hypothetical protein BDV93DRAFT_174901 [Ceratobasidium sp. AG-I]
MGSQAANLPAVHLEGPAHTLHYPYHRPYPHSAFNQLRHQLSAPLCAQTYPDAKSWAQPTVMPVFPHSYLNGQDATYSFPQGAPPYHLGFYDNDSVFNGDDLEVGSTSGEDDVEVPDCNAQLRSQQLNSDGTPKRPMNAFMIFARKRRPMVSSEQPTMRTGEISKILSKEWSEMPKEDKQFYLDQAKKLKDTFNSRWPDYVYRRRPNNSRKRRKLGGATGIGPIRNGDLPDDGRVGTPVDPAAANFSGDETRSQSADSFSSPMSTQSRLLYPAADFGHAAPTHGLDRSPLSSNIPLVYGAPSVYAQPIPAGTFSEAPSLVQPEAQPHFYGAEQTSYYAPIGAGEEHIAETSPQMKNWHPFEVAPSGTVASSTPPLSAPTEQLEHNAESAEQLYDWPKTQTQLCQAPDNSWSLAMERREVQGPLMNALLREELPEARLDFRPATGGAVALPIPHLYDNGEITVQELGKYHPTYMDSNRFNHVLHTPSSPYAGELRGGSPSAYITTNRWVPGMHSN